MRISWNELGIRGSGCTTSSIEGVSDGCMLGLHDSISAERVGVYEGMYRSEKYSLVGPSDRIGPMAWRGREQNTDVGHHQTWDCSGTFNLQSLSITRQPTRS